MASKGDISKHEIQPSYPRRWPLVSYDEILEKTKIDVKLKSKDFNSTGIYPVVDQGAQLIAGYVDDEDLLYNGELPVIIFGDHTKNIKYVDFKFAVGADGTKLLKPISGISELFLYYNLLSLNLPDFGYSRHFSVFKILDFPLPTLAEQERIVAKIDKLFYKIECVRKRVYTIIRLKSKFFESIFYESAGLTTLSNFVVERNKRVGENWFEYDKIGVSAKDGIIDLDAGTKKTFEKYKIVEPGDIIYNTMRINIGSVAVYEGNSPAITSPDYVVFSVKKASKYLVLNYLKSEVGKTNISSATTGSVRSRLYFKNLVNIPFPEITSERHKFAESILKWFESSIAKIRIIDTDLLSKLSKAILQQAFKGKLVGQLPTDGDAKELEILTLKNETKGK